eukprot:gene11252-12432_t
MSSTASVEERLRQLEETEQDITEVIKCASIALGELAKEAPSEDTITRNTTEFIKKLEDIERNLLEQINYMSQKKVTSWMYGRHRLLNQK